jgi:hypothetical protein
VVVWRCDAPQHEGERAARLLGPSLQRNKQSLMRRMRVPPLTMSSVRSAAGASVRGAVPGRACNPCWFRGQAFGHHGHEKIGAPVPCWNLRSLRRVK